MRTCSQLGVRTLRILGPSASTSDALREYRSSSPVPPYIPATPELGGIDTECGGTNADELPPKDPLPPPLGASTGAEGETSSRPGEPPRAAAEAAERGTERPGAPPESLPLRACMCWPARGALAAVVDQALKGHSNHEVDVWEEQAG